MTDSPAPPQDTAPRIKMYAHNACPQVPGVRAMLKQSKAPFDYINIHHDHAARKRVRAINDGYESVPTLEFPDGSTLTEPGAGQLRAKLQSLGYSVPLTALVMANLHLLIIGAVVLFALLSAIGLL